MGPEAGDERERGAGHERGGGTERSADTGAPRCWACGSTRLEAFYRVTGVPVHSCVLTASEAEALAFPLNDVELDFCHECGFIQNSRFDPSLLDYFQEYEETQGFSPTFRRFAEELAGDLVERYGLRGKDILEIGCGKGEFLALLAAGGANRGVCIDPSTVPERVPDPAPGTIEVIRDYYDARYADLEADFICCRHTLEHVQPVAAFVRLTLEAASQRPGAHVFYEVPDVRRVLEETAFWDIYHEHCSYFTLGSLARLFRREGGAVVDLGTAFAEQYLLIGAVPAGEQGTVTTGGAAAEEESVGELAALVEGFQTRSEETLARWRDRIGDAAAAGSTVVLWGGGSKAVAFATTLGLEEEVAYVVDINPHKQGKFLPGTARRVVGPDHLDTQPPDLVVVMNPIYEAEIAGAIAQRGIRSDIVSV